MSLISHGNFCRAAALCAAVALVAPAAGAREMVRVRYLLPQPEEEELVSYLHDHAEGNPFFIGELLRAMEEGGTLRRENAQWSLDDPARAGVPSLLRQVIDTRVDRLGDAARDLLSIAAIIGQEVPLATWATVAETDEEVVATMDDLRAIGCDILTLGQYLRPTPNHLPVERYVTPESFLALREAALARGFLECVSGPMVRSSYRAEQALAGNNCGLGAG